MKKIFRFLSEFVLGVWNVRFSKVGFWIFHILLTFCCSFMSMIPDIQPLYFSWINVCIPQRYVGYGLLAFCILWIWITGFLAVSGGRTHTGQLCASGAAGYGLLRTLTLAQQRPVWALLLITAGILWGLRIPCSEYLNRPRGGADRPHRLRVATLSRRIATLAFCMTFSAVLLFLSPLLPPYAERSVVQGAADEGIVIADEHWAALDEGERYQLLQLILAEECADAGIDRPALSVSSSFPETTLAGFMRDSYEIVLNRDILSEQLPSACVNTILHEFRHCWQYDLALRCDDGTLSADQQLLAEAYRDNLSDYLTSAVNGYEAYRSQLIEADARQYAGERMEAYFPAAD